MSQRISPAALRATLDAGTEVALIDVREEAAFGQSHLLLAANLPLSRLELLVRDLVPRQHCRVVVCDADGDAGGPAERAAARLRTLGYDDVAVIDGGAQGWESTGGLLFSGVNVPSKAFGEVVYHECATPEISATDLKAQLDASSDLVVLDSRPWDEYRAMNIPGGIDVPGAELVYRLHDLAPDPDTLVVVNCAGRTRSIIGAQSLIDAGVPNRVVALRDGTMGWHLAGFTLEHGADRRPGMPSEAARAVARERAAAVARRWGVRCIDAGTLAVWRAEADDRTLYLLDVRLPEAFAAGHLPGSRSAPGGQLVQATDRYMATRNARVVLIDEPDAVRATMTAAWLTRMGWPEVVVYPSAELSDAARLETGSWHPTLPDLDGLPACEAIAPAVLADRLSDPDLAVIDLGRSSAYRDGHIPGAYFAVRARLADSLQRLPETGTIVLTAENEVLARLAAAEVAAITGRAAACLHGGTPAWQDAGLPLETGWTRALDEADDVHLRPYDRAKGVEQAMRDYLAWEIDLLDRVAKDGTLSFRI